MSDIHALESRITAALDRIGAGIDADRQAVGGEDNIELETRLVEEQLANAQLQERVRLLKERQDGRMAELEDRVDAQRSQMAKLDAELQRLRASNADLREMSAQLRTAATEGVASPELVNRAMIAEIDALDAQRRAESAEVAAILAELKPLIEEA
jgi:chromosome segregation ATPase